MTSRTKGSLILIVFAAALLLSGCSTPQVSENPSQRFNSAMPAGQRATLAARKQRNGE